MTTLARWCFQHRRIVIGVWLLALVVGGVLTQTVGTAYSDQFKRLA